MTFNPPPVFGTRTIGQAAFGWFSIISIWTSPKTVLSKLVNLLSNCFGQKICAHSVSGEGCKHSICHLKPTCIWQKIEKSCKPPFTLGNQGPKVCHRGFGEAKPLFNSTPTSKKLLQYLSHWMFAVRAWSIKCRRKEKLIAQFGGKLRDERFKLNVWTLFTK